MLEILALLEGKQVAELRSRGPRHKRAPAQAAEVVRHKQAPAQAAEVVPHKQAPAQAAEVVRHKQAAVCQN